MSRSATTTYAKPAAAFGLAASLLVAVMVGFNMNRDIDAARARPARLRLPPKGQNRQEAQRARKPRVAGVGATRLPHRRSPTATLAGLR
ncbi:MAG: hypothetical protein U5O39_01050 [Gammaproteobacteria bacterium]|nr:hypothetical protein [Gammaproteobacteria bacterium]